MYIILLHYKRLIDFQENKIYNKNKEIYVKEYKTMSVRNAGAAIREARLKAGLSQEKLSDGICSVLSLSRIENGTAGVSPSTFQALMAHAGAPCEVFPVFANRKDFDCFYTLKKIRFYLDYWQLSDAYNELEKIEQMNFAENKYYYQEWLLLHCRLQFRSGCGIHAQIYQTLLDALHISRPQIDLSDFRGFLLSLNEIELLIAIAQEALYLNKLDVSLEICTQISTYLENSQIMYLEKDRLLAENVIVFSKYLLATRDYKTSLKVTDTFRLKIIENADDAPLHELTFLYGLSLFYNNKTDDALIMLKTAFFSAHSIASCYATTIRNYLKEVLGISLFDASISLEDIPLIFYAQKKIIDTANFSHGTYDFFSPDILTIGSLIRELRSEQNISQEILCYGLCSKSKLSKIENDALQPDVALAQTLLQRLGISDTIFTFYGNEHEFKLQNLKSKLASIPLSHKDDILFCVEEMLQIYNEKDIFYFQYACYRKARCISDSAESASVLLEALAITIPNFDFNNLLNYRLSWLELTILHNYCDIYSKQFLSKSILYIYKILDYYSQTTIDVLEAKRLLPISIYLLNRLLYRQKRFSEIAETNIFSSYPAAKFFLRYTGATYGHYAQALGELQLFEHLQRFGSYSYYNSLIVEAKSNAYSIKNTISTNFHIELL